MTLARRVSSQSPEAIAREWDAIAEIRHRQILDMTDLSYHLVLVPTLLRMLNELKSSKDELLDVGCGTGHLTSLLASQASTVTGVDPSPASVRIATELGSGTANTSFVVSTIEDFAEHCAAQFDVAIANMVLMDCLDLGAALRAISMLLRPKGCLIATITHPWFWPRYWGYENESWFRYSDETIVQAPFAISAEPTNLLTTHVHRPLEQYIATLAQHGFRLHQLKEPLPSVEAERRYPSLWQYPRYLAFAATI